jgi:hypothetical protein
MGKTYYIQLLVPNEICRLFNELANRQGYTMSEWLRLLVRNELERAGVREYKYISVPVSRDVQKKPPTSYCLQAQVCSEVKEAFRHYAEAACKSNMQMTLRRIVLDALNESGEHVKWEQMKYSQRVGKNNPG